MIMTQTSHMWPLRVALEVLAYAIAVTCYRLPQGAVKQSSRQKQQLFLVRRYLGHMNTVLSQVPSYTA